MTVTLPPLPPLTAWTVKDELDFIRSLPNVVPAASLEQTLRGYLCGLRLRTDFSFCKIPFEECANELLLALRADKSHV